MRIIDADAVKSIIRSGVSTDTEADQDYVCERIDDAPSIDIVRCKECKHWRSDGGAMMVCENTDIPTDACDFCSWGEREGE